MSVTERTAPAVSGSGPLNLPKALLGAVAFMVPAALVLFSPEILGDVEVATLVAAPVALVVLAGTAAVLIARRRRD